MLNRPDVEILEAEAVNSAKVAPASLCSAEEDLSRSAPRAISASSNGW